MNTIFFIDYTRYPIHATLNILDAGDFAPGISYQLPSIYDTFGSRHHPPHLGCASRSSSGQAFPHVVISPERRVPRAMATMLCDGRPTWSRDTFDLGHHTQLIRIF